jgi:pyruvate/2-oxoglutarate dehydrogenase complex dihydrolipoamide dehydrogenase (E3) component
MPTFRCNWQHGEKREVPMIQVPPWDEYNQQLVQNVHPPDWVSPEPARRYQLVVIGAGTAGLVAAAGAAILGAKVALIERELMGGDCLNVGCVPSKALLASARAYAAVRDAHAFGIEVPPGTKVNFAAVMERLRRLRAQLSPNDSAARFRGLGVDVFFGQARFTGPQSVTVGERTLHFSRAVLATGTRASKPQIPGIAEAGYLTNETVFTLTELPRRLAVIGAGPVGCELAQAFVRLGSEVTLLGNRPQILPREDREAAAIVEQAMRRDGVKLLLGCAESRVERQGTEKVLHLECGGESQELRVDEILVGVGRTPNVDGMSLEAAGVKYDLKNGVEVNDKLRTSNRHIYAAGDVCSRFKFTHAADAMARIAIQNALFWPSARVSALTVPWCTYTDPEIAHVGLYESEAKERGLAVQTFAQPLQHVDRAVLDGTPEGFVKVHVRRGTGRIVGATIVAPHAGEMISEVTLAMVGRLGLGTLARTIHPYPTQAEAIRKTADAYSRARLTPLVKWLLGRWLAWMR